MTFSRFSLVTELGTCGHCIALGSSLKLQYSTKPCITFQAACFSGLGCSCSQATDLVWWYIVVLSICLNAQRFENLQRLIELIEKHVFTVNQMLKAPLTAFLSCMHGKTWAPLSNLTHFLSNPSGRQASPHIISHNSCRQRKQTKRLIRWRIGSFRFVLDPGFNHLATFAWGRQCDNVSDLVNWTLFWKHFPAPKESSKIA